MNRRSSVEGACPARPRPHGWKRAALVPGRTDQAGQQLPSVDQAGAFRYSAAEFIREASHGGIDELRTHGTCPVRASFTVLKNLFAPKLRGDVIGAALNPLLREV